MEGQCLYKCPKKYFSDGKDCKACDLNCETCYGPTKNNCLSCTQPENSDDSDIINNNKNDKNKNLDNNNNGKLVYLLEGTCVDSCPVGAFPDKEKFIC